MGVGFRPFCALNPRPRLRCLVQCRAHPPRPALRPTGGPHRIPFRFGADQRKGQPAVSPGPRARAREATSGWGTWRTQECQGPGERRRSLRRRAQRGQGGDAGGESHSSRRGLGSGACEGGSGPGVEAEPLGHGGVEVVSLQRERVARELQHLGVGLAGRDVHGAR